MTLRQIYADAPGQAELVWKMGAKAKTAANEIDQFVREIMQAAHMGVGDGKVVAFWNQKKRRANA